MTKKRSSSIPVVLAVLTLTVASLVAAFGPAARAGTGPGGALEADVEATAESPGEAAAESPGEVVPGSSLVGIPGISRARARAITKSSTWKKSSSWKKAPSWRYALPGGSPPLSMEPDRRGRPLLYLALQKGGLSVLDVSGARPIEVAKMTPERFDGLAPTWVAQQESVLYVSLGNFFQADGARAGLAAVDITDPRRPELLSIITSRREFRGTAIVLLDGDTAYVGGMGKGVFILDVSGVRAREGIDARGRPGVVDEAVLDLSDVQGEAGVADEATRRGFRLVSWIQPDIHFPTPNPNRRQHPNARGLAIRGDLLYVAYDAGGLRIIDVSNRRRPREVGRWINPEMGNKPQAYNHVLLDWPYLYAAIDYCGLEVLDVRDPRDIRQVGWWNPWNCDSLFNVWFNSDGHTNQMALDRKRQLLYLSAGDSELEIIDVADPARPNPVPAGSGVPHADHGKAGNGLGTWGLTLTDEFIYLAYIETLIPFRGTRSGIQALPR